eukprot:scaffold120720_cov51-Prasinocladus_malaysianus.AAC.3
MPQLAMLSTVSHASLALCIGSYDSSGDCYALSECSFPVTPWAYKKPDVASSQSTADIHVYLRGTRSVDGCNPFRDVRRD